MDDRESKDELTDELTDALKKFDTRVRAYFHSHSTVSKLIKDALKKLRNSAFTLSKYLTTAYIATFLFFISTHEAISKLTGGIGPVLWTMTVILICLVIESIRTIKLFLGSGTQNYIENTFNEILESASSLDDQGREDFNMFLDQIGEEYVQVILGKKFKFKFFSFLNPSKKEESEKEDESVSKAMAATNRLISQAEKSKESIQNAIKKEANLLKKEFGNNFASIVLACLVFCLYLLGLSIILFCALKENFSVMFSAIVSIWEWVIR